MDDLISRAEILGRIKSMAGCATCDNYNGVRCRACIWDDAMNIVKEAPAVDAVPVVHAKWDLTISMHYVERWQADANCSCCDFTKNNVWSGFFPDLPPGTARLITQHYAEKVKLPTYCERCGAKMDSERRDEDAAD